MYHVWAHRNILCFTLVGILSTRSVQDCYYLNGQHACGYIHQPQAWGSRKLLSDVFIIRGRKGYQGIKYNLLCACVCVSNDIIGIHKTNSKVMTASLSFIFNHCSNHRPKLPCSKALSTGSGFEATPITVGSYIVIVWVKCLLQAVLFGSSLVWRNTTYSLNWVCPINSEWRGMMGTQQNPWTSSSGELEHVM